MKNKGTAIDKLIDEVREGRRGPWELYEPAPTYEGMTDLEKKAWREVLAEFQNNMIEGREIVALMEELFSRYEGWFSSGAKKEDLNKVLEDWISGSVSILRAPVEEMVTMFGMTTLAHPKVDVIIRSLPKIWKFLFYSYLQTFKETMEEAAKGYSL